jgi:hypothetical protein
MTLASAGLAADPPNPSTPSLTRNADWSLVGVSPDRRALLVVSRAGPSRCFRVDFELVDQTTQRVRVRLLSTQATGDCVDTDAFVIPQPTVLKLSRKLNGQVISGPGKRSLSVEDDWWVLWTHDKYPERGRKAPSVVGLWANEATRIARAVVGHSGKVRVQGPGQGKVRTQSPAPGERLAVKSPRIQLTTSGG